MYLDEVADVIRKHVPEEHLPKGDTQTLFRSYAVLLQAKGAAVIDSDVHDAWSAWMTEQNPQHESLLPFAKLSSAVQAEDHVFAEAIRNAAREIDPSALEAFTFEKALFPVGPPKLDTNPSQLLDLYKIIVGSSEALVGRRQAVNTFFLTMNGALLTGYGLVVQHASISGVTAVALGALAIAGAVLCLAWRSLILSFGQLNKGKFKVINRLERYLSAGIYAAEWEALERGENPKVYRSFTSREIWVPNAILVIHAAVFVSSLLLFFGLITLGSPVSGKELGTSVAMVPATSRMVSATLPFAPATPSNEWKGSTINGKDLVPILNEQLLKAWEIYVSFFTVFLTVNITALGVVMTKMRANTGRAVVSIVFIVQNMIAVVTGFMMYRYTANMTAGMSTISPVLGHFGPLGDWAGNGNAIGHFVIGGAWVYVLVKSLRVSRATKAPEAPVAVNGELRAES